MSADMLPFIRNAARAIIIRDDRILLLKKSYEDKSIRYALPGGGQDTGETLKQALTRECLEEIGCDITIGPLKYIADYFKIRDTQPSTQRHLLEMLFSCSIPADYEPRCGHRPDKHQVDVIWAELDQLRQLPLYPQFLKHYITIDTLQGSATYLGSFTDDAAIT